MSKMAYNLLAIREALEELTKRATSRKGLLFDYGICLNIYSILHEEDETTHEFVAEYSLGWKHHADSWEYPVPKTDSLWEGEGLDYRLDLIKYLICKIDKELGARNDI